MKTSSREYALVTLVTAWTMLAALPAAEAEAANECEIKYLYTTSLAKNERERWATVGASAGKSVPVRGRQYLKQVQNTGKHDVSVFIAKQRKPMYLRPREKRNTSRMGSATLLTRVQCLTTIAGKPQQRTASKSSSAQVKRSTKLPASSATRQNNAVAQKPPTAATRLNRVPLQQGPPGLQSNDPNYQQYNNTFSSRPRYSSAPSAGSSGGQQSGSPSSGSTATAKAFDYFECNYSNHRAVNAYLLAMVSKMIYPITSNGSDNEDGNWNKFKSRFKNQLRDLGMDNVQPIRDTGTGTEAAVMSNEGCIFVVFRGSQGPQSANFSGVKDWMVDFNITPFPPPPPLIFSPDAMPPWWWATGVIVSNGNYLALQSVYPDIKTAINAQQSQSGSKKLFIAGHSLGGALAILATYQLQKEGEISTKAVYTFGGPKVGGLFFWNDYNATVNPGRTHRWTFELDPVPHMPPSLADYNALNLIASNLGFPLLDIPPIPSTFRHVGTQLKPSGSFGDRCVHSITVYGEGIIQTLTSSQRNQLPDAWLDNSSVAIGNCLL